MKSEKYVIFSLILLFSLDCKKEEKKITVPNMVGMKIEEVKNKYPDIKINVRTFREDPIRKEGEICFQSYKAGVEISKKEMVNVDVSSGFIPSAENLKLDGEIKEVTLRENGVKFRILGTIRNPNSYPVYVDNFYYTAYNDKGKKDKHQTFDLNIWIPPNAMISKSYEGFISPEELGLDTLAKNLVISKIVIGCVYDTHEGKRSTTKVFNPQTITKTKEQI